MNFSRRNVLFSGVSLGTLVLAGCSVTSSKGGVTVTLDVTQVEYYFTAAEAAFNILTTIPAFNIALGPAGLATARLAEETIKASLSAFVQQVGSSPSVSLSNTSVKSTLNSCLQAMNTMLNAFQAALSSMAPSAVNTQISTSVAAFESIVSLFTIMLTQSPLSAPTTLYMYHVAPMSEQDALKTLHVTDALRKMTVEKARKGI